MSFEQIDLAQYPHALAAMIELDKIREYHVEMDRLQAEVERLDDIVRQFRAQIPTWITYDFSQESWPAPNTSDVIILLDRDGEVFVVDIFPFQPNTHQWIIKSRDGNEPDEFVQAECGDRWTYLMNSKTEV